jgi:hypothetical protein
VKIRIRRPRCYVCEQPYIPHRHGNAELHVLDRTGRAVEAPLKGHPDCLADLALRHQADRKVTL